MRCSLSKNKRKNLLNFNVVERREDRRNVRIKKAHTKERERKDGGEDLGPDTTDQTFCRFPPGEALKGSVEN